MSDRIKRAEGVSSSTWSILEEAFRERMEAVELFLADVAGRFRFRKNLPASPELIGLIESERANLVSDLPNFQRRIWLGAADVVCDSNGQFWFVDDHYCCPFGLYRFSQLLADSDGANANYAFAGFQRSVREDLRRKQGDTQNSVVLGSGTFNTVYRENRFYADFLGIPFATQHRLKIEGRTLVCREGSSSRRIGLVVRRLQDDDLDSGCYRRDSMQGVLGIVRAARKGHVRVMNAPGTGLFNHRSISSLIPSMVRFYLGREPSLPTVPTQSTSVDGILDSRKTIDGLVLRTNNSMDVMKPLFGSDCTDKERGAYLNRVKANPRSFVIRESLRTASSNTASAAYSVRLFAAGTSRRIVLRGGIRRDCHVDGTPKSPITQDTSAGCLQVSEASRSSVGN